MRLKSLELKGFKSFANDTLIHFDEDVIGIVGPNGSGKSNVVDAIRWVLGEQKGKELRLENMGDVIFNGTKKRKPAPVAQVAITFDNNLGILPSEYQEVVISRHLYRSGESEYKLNGVTCRLKDIHGLLLDTGIGSNSYAIIALGMVDDILYDKENARRRMFEQAAGISKYKKRKHETLLKLKLTSDDLVRIDDILKEIQTNLEALEKQAKRTKRYFELKQDYRELSLNLGARNNIEIRQQFDVSEKRIQDETDQYTRLEADVDVLHAEIERLRKDHLGDEETVSAFQKDLNELVGSIRSMENEKNLADQKIAFLRQTKQRLETQVSHAGERSKELHARMEELQGTVLERQMALTSHEMAIKAAIEQRDEIAVQVRELVQSRDSVSQIHQQFEKELYDLEKQIALLQHNTHMLRKENEVIDAEHWRLSEEYDQLEEQLTAEAERKSSASSQLAALEEEEQHRLKSIREHETSLTQDLDQLRHLQRTLDARSHEAELLRDMISNLEGFPESIKFLSKTQDWNVTAPFLSDLIYCEQSYRVMVEQILEQYLNYYVVHTWDEATRAIKLLGFAQKGRANFFILEEYRDSRTTASRHGLAPLLDFIQIEPGYEHLIRHLLHDVYVTEGSANDPHLQEQAPDDLVIIDRQALMIRRKGQLAGGSVGLFEGKRLGRKKHLEHLEKEIVELRQSWHQLKSKSDQTRHQLEALQAIDQSAHLQSLRSELVNISQAWTETNSRLSHVRQRMEEAANRRNKNQDSIDATTIEADQVALVLTEKKSAHASHTASLEASEEKNEVIQRQLNEAETRVNELRLEELHLKNKLESLERELSYHREQVEQLHQTRDNQLQQLETESQELESMSVSSANLAEELIQRYHEKKEKETRLSAAEQKYYQQRHDIGLAEEKLKAAEKQRSNQQYLINELKDQHNQLKFKLVAISERMQVEFGIRLEDITEEHLNDELPLDELEAKVQRLRNRLDNYGEINPMAIEAHEEIKARYDTINQQRLDILSAKESLLATITEIEESATSKFMESFDRVRENFIEVFRSLFTEDDTCDLILMDPDDPLESAIDIIAKPKGKRPRSLSQLSGGEKTLTAIALLFALYLLKPAPFCVFDEVDAPLDDANIQKFNRIIKKFSSQSQFIIVTHNKTTMAAVDVIYGVYMEEQGVSGLSQVDFRAFDESDVLALQN